MRPTPDNPVEPHAGQHVPTPSNQTITLHLYSLHAWNTLSQAVRLQARLNELPGIQHVNVDEQGDTLHVTFGAPMDRAAIEQAVHTCGLFTSPEAMVHEYRAWQAFLAHDDLNDA